MLAGGADAGSVVTNLLDMVQTLRARCDQLEEALESRVAIEQAKGVLAERFAIDPEEAFVLLRRAARSSRVKLRDLAQRVTTSRETPQEIQTILERWEQHLGTATT